MKVDRRCSSISDRRESERTKLRRARLLQINERRMARNKAPIAAVEEVRAMVDRSIGMREVAVESREDGARLRENANLVREREVHVREDAAHGREERVLVREESATSREQGIRNERIWKAAEKNDRHAKLLRANEQLVISAVQLQNASDEIEKTKVDMTHLAHHDFLTDLPNRIQLYDRIAQSISLARRHQSKLTVLFLDLDRFKIVNDTHGHAIGDKLLQAVASRLTGAVRNTDTVSRLGGDEFVLLLSEVGQEEALVRTIKKIHQIVSAPYSVDGMDLQIGATIGVSIFPVDGGDTETLIRNADAAMYHAKRTGRNRYQFYREEMQARDVEPQEIEVGLRQALDKHQFVLFYQAQIALKSGAVIGAEALIRWRHPSKGLLSPAWFVPIAEDCGAIVPIGRWVLREACRQAKAWLDDGLKFHLIAVNISAREFEHDGFLECVRSILRDTGLAPGHLEIELTETVLMKRIESTVVKLDALRSMGVRISIDDFGTGYSSLSYLKRFPIDTLKIDQSFVRDISNGVDDIPVNAIIQLGKNLQHQVIAEGVETAQQFAFLRANQCPAVQGHYLNIPMPAEEFAGFLQGRNTAI